jgi:hypothetical protein
MKNSFIFLLVIIALMFDLSARAQVIAIGSGTVLSNATVNSSILQTNQVQEKVGQFIVAHGAMASTNDLAGFNGFSIDGVNWITNVPPVYNPVSTNAGGDIIYQATYTLNVYNRVTGVGVTNGPGNTTGVSASMIYIPHN